jgi:hypothetical protein
MKQPESIVRIKRSFDGQKPLLKLKSFSNLKSLANVKIKIVKGKNKRTRYLENVAKILTKNILRTSFRKMGLPYEQVRALQRVLSPAKGAFAKWKNLPAYRPIDIFSMSFEEIGDENGNFERPSSKINQYASMVGPENFFAGLGSTNI